MDTPNPPGPAVTTRLRRGLYITVGLFFVGVAALGALLPVLPTTPFLLLASFFFVRSAPALNRRLLRSPWFGKFLRDWQQHRGVTPRTKFTAVSVLALATGSSAWFGNLSVPLLALLLGLAGIGLVVVLRLPVIRQPHDAPEPVSSGAERS